MVRQSFRNLTVSHLCPPKLNKLMWVGMPYHDRFKFSLYFPSSTRQSVDVKFHFVEDWRGICDLKLSIFQICYWRAKKRAEIEVKTHVATPGSQGKRWAFEIKGEHHLNSWICSVQNPAIIHVWLLFWWKSSIRMHFFHDNYRKGLLRHFLDRRDDFVHFWKHVPYLFTPQTKYRLIFI